MDRERWNGGDEPSSPFGDPGHLLADLGTQVPRQDEQQVGPELTQDVRMEDRQATAGQKASLFVRAAIDGQFDEVTADLKGFDRPVEVRLVRP